MGPYGTPPPVVSRLCEVQVSVKAPQGRTTAQNFIAEASQEPGAPRGPADAADAAEVDSRWTMLGPFFGPNKYWCWEMELMEWDDC